MIECYLNRDEVIPIPLDTIHAGNLTSTRSAPQLENLLRRLDVVITTRLHGLVFALKAGIPAVAIDPVAGGGKVTAQARAVGWPLVLSGDGLNPEQIGDAIRQCLSGSMHEHVARANAVAQERIDQMKIGFFTALSQIQMPEVRA